MLLYYITDRKQFAGGDADQRRRVLDKIGEAARAGVDLIQLREKDLPGRRLEELAREAIMAVRENSSTTKLLINSRIDVALACGADGVHLTSTDIPASDARAIAAAADSERVAGNSERTERAVSVGLHTFVIAVSSHSLREVELAYAHGADLVVFGPVFEKASAPARGGAGIEAVRDICAKFTVKGESANEEAFPVLALGGITLQNARACLEAGAAGVAAIRLFQDGSISETVARLRALATRCKPAP